MFLSHLNPDQRNSFLALVTKVVMADGDVTPEEEILLEHVRAELGGNVVAPMDEIFGAPNLDVFSDRKSRVIVVLELLLTGHVDRKYHVDEAQVVEQIAKDLGFGETEMASMQDWAIRTAVLVREGTALMRE